MRMRLGVAMAAMLCAIAVTPSREQNVQDGKKAFEVVSIRPTAGNTMKGFRWAPTQDGYRTEGQSIYATIMIAYFPEAVQYWKEERLMGAPAWVTDTFYDIEGKVAAEDLPEWQKQTPLKHEMLNAMLRTMLEERCKLVLRRTMVSAPALALEVGSKGPKLKESVAGAPLPDQAVKLVDGGVMVPMERGAAKHELKFFGATMTSLARYLTGPSAVPVQDMTGLTGRYDFVLTRREDAGGTSADPAEPTPWELGDLGLVLKGIKAPTLTLVIDHIERPSAN
jgi:uncharacterized protein (TIGR03435 family)